MKKLLLISLAVCSLHSLKSQSFSFDSYWSDSKIFEHSKSDFLNEFPLIQGLFPSLKYQLSSETLIHESTLAESMKNDRTPALEFQVPFQRTLSEPYDPQSLQQDPLIHYHLLIDHPLQLE